MKSMNSNKKWFSISALALTLALVIAMLSSGVLAEEGATGVPGDTNPAIMVTQKTAASVVGVITNAKDWNRQTRETTETMVSQGSGVVIEKGYVLTNFHVVENGTDFQVVLPSGEYAEAKLVGSDASTDLAVLKVESDELVPVEIGSSNNLLVGSTVIAIGNPGGTALANTVTSGIVSALERTVQARNTTRDIAYIQHDAAINSGNSGGGLFNVNGQLIGINTLKYQGSVYSSVTFEGLGFAIPVDLAYPIAQQLIEHGKVLRPQMGVTVANQSGPDEPMNNYPPVSVCVYSVNEGSPAERAGVKQYDFITEVDGVRVTTLRELTAEMDKHEAGDTVEITVVRYQNPAALGMGDSYSTDDQNDSYYNNPFGYFFGNPYGGGNSRSNSNAYTTGGFETIKLNVTLEIIE